MWRCKKKLHCYWGTPCYDCTIFIFCFGFSFDCSILILELDYFEFALRRPYLGGNTPYQGFFHIQGSGPEPLVKRGTISSVTPHLFMVWLYYSITEFSFLNYFFSSVNSQGGTNNVFLMFEGLSYAKKYLRILFDLLILLEWK